MVLLKKILFAPKHLEISTRNRKTKNSKEHQHEYITNTLTADTLNVF